MFEPGAGGAKLGWVRHEPGQDDDARRVAHEPLGHRDQRVGARLVGDRDENRRNSRRCRRVEVERRIVPEDGALDLLELGARFDSELVDENPARALIRVERLRLPARPVQRSHQIHPQPLPKRVFGNQCLELCDQSVVAAERRSASTRSSTAASLISSSRAMAVWAKLS